MVTSTATPSRHGPGNDADQIHVSPSDIAVGVVIGRTSEFFDFFVFAIAAVIVFPARLFPFADPLTGTLLSFGLVLLAFVARPVGTAIFMYVDRKQGRVAKLTLALFLLGTSTVAMGLVPSYAVMGEWAIVVMAVLRIGQGLAIGGSWDGLASLLALSAPERKRGFYAMVPQLGAPIGLIVAALLFSFLVSNMSEQDFLDWGWRYPFFVAFSVNVVALFARLRIIASPEFQEAFETRELQPTRIRQTFRSDWRAIWLASFVPLASFAMFHMVTVFPLSWVYLYTGETLTFFLNLTAVSAAFGLGSILLSGWLSDRFGRRRVLIWGAVAIGVFSLMAPLLLQGGKTGESVYMIAGFLILGISFGQSSGALASMFNSRNRYTDSAFASALGWLFGAGLAPLTALFLSTTLGLFAAGLYLLSGAVATVVALWLVRQLEFQKQG
ncbi:Inner membrane metabolite transport protein YhjE [Paracoccus haematequi]|uniref:Inner membrane metabolite transport protein YhjE n=1 Tax=Paracoccus haematequi TaxID=2491866 RepID=A0A447ILW2_9RHOB|nr:MFS transporter [Paracoccus haematequi]VDS08513.1 Inner membrane metabolite transport protein YhjE [Paracoccus haematequi]